jgi:hypothetical protein
MSMTSGYFCLCIDDSRDLGLKPPVAKENNTFSLTGSSYPCCLLMVRHHGLVFYVLLFNYVYSSVFCKDHQCLALTWEALEGKGGSSLASHVGAPPHVGLEANNNNNKVK